MSIEVKNIGKHFGNFVALNNVSLEFATGELTALLGPSGCGKTTLLRVIAGLEQADQGQVILDGEDASVRHVRERQVGFVFQHYALFKHMSVFENIAFGLRVKPRAIRPSEAQIREKVMRLLSLVQLDWLADRYPSQLSGGQRQRIALARALAVEPRVLLLDEPASALDPIATASIEELLVMLKSRLSIVIVTHSMQQAARISDETAVFMVDASQGQGIGELVEKGETTQVFTQPNDPRTESYISGRVG
jgi:sulfate transport system ATP-binding protein